MSVLAAAANTIEQQNNNSNDNSNDNSNANNNASNNVNNNNLLHPLSALSDYRNSYYNDFIRRSLSVPNGRYDTGPASPGASEHTTTAPDAAPMTPTDNAAPLTPTDNAAPLNPTAKGAGWCCEGSGKALAVGQKRRWRHKKYDVRPESREEWWYPPNQAEPPLKVTVTDVTCNCQRVTFVESTTDEGFFRTRTDP